MPYKDKQKQKDYMRAYKKARYPYNAKCLTQEQMLLKRLRDKKAQCQSQKIDFNLTLEYLKSIWTGECPILGVGISLDPKEPVDTKAHLDRVNPNLGYTQDNVRWVSGKANRLKSDLTKEDLLKILAYLES